MYWIYYDVCVFVVVFFSSIKNFSTRRPIPIREYGAFT